MGEVIPNENPLCLCPSINKSPLFVSYDNQQILPDDRTTSCIYGGSLPSVVLPFRMAQRLRDGEESVSKMRKRLQPTPKGERGSSSPPQISRGVSAPVPSTATSTMEDSKIRSGLVKMKKADIKMFQRWIRCFCIVDFDLDLGQKMRSIFPSNPARHKLSREEIAAITSLSFPDSNCTKLGDQVYCFRFQSRKHSTRKGGKTSIPPKRPPSSPPPTEQLPETAPRETGGGKDAVSGTTQSMTESKTQSPEDAKNDSSSNDSNHKEQALLSKVNKVRTIAKFIDEYPNNDVWIRLLPAKSGLIDSSFEGKLYASFCDSRTIVSDLLLIAALNSQIISIVGSMYFSVGNACIEAACQNISQWPRLRSGVEVQLPLLGSVINFSAPRLPRSDALFFRMMVGVREKGSTVSTALSSRQLLSNPSSLMGWFVQKDLYSSLFFVIHHLWHFWEIIITGKPLLVGAALCLFSPLLCPLSVTATIAS
eukprot:jgi/Bigna1/128084/aug1.5_g2792